MGPVRRGEEGAKQRQCVAQSEAGVAARRPGLSRTSRDGGDRPQSSSFSPQPPAFPDQIRLDPQASVAHPVLQRGRLGRAETRRPAKMQTGAGLEDRGGEDSRGLRATRRSRARPRLWSL